MGVAEPPRRRPADERVLRLVDEDREGRGEQRNVHSLAGRAIRGRRASSAARTATAPWSPAMTSAIATPTFVGPPPSSSAAPVIDISPDTAWIDEVVARPVGVGAGRAVARDREMDETRVDRRQLLVAEAQAGEAAGSEVLDDHVGAGEEASKNGRAIGLLEVEPDAPLVAVDGEVIGSGSRAVGLVADPWRSPAARRVALRRLDLDDVGPEVGQQHRAVGPGEDRRAVDDAETGERAGAADWTFADGSGTALGARASSACRRLRCVHA